MKHEIDESHEMRTQPPWQEHSTKEHLGNETKPRLAGDELDDFRARCRGRSLPE